MLNAVMQQPVVSGFCYRQRLPSLSCCHFNKLQRMASCPINKATCTNMANMAATVMGRLPLFLTIFSLLPSLSLPEDILGVKTDDFDFDGLPGVQHEFKVEVIAGKEECFFQTIKKGAQLHVSFEVLQGGDNLINFITRDPNGMIIEHRPLTASGLINTEVHFEGVYGFCIDNSFSRFSSKMVYFYLVTYVVAEWERFTAELTEIDLSVGNSTNSLKVVDQNINAMLRMQAVSRQHVVADWYLIHNNNQHIQRWSILMICIICGSGCLQVFFVRRLFKSQMVTPTSKPRA